MSRLSRNQKVIFIYFFLPTPLQSEKFNSALTILCRTKKEYTHTVIILDFWGYLLKGKNFPLPEKKKIF